MIGKRLFTIICAGLCLLMLACPAAAEEDTSESLTMPPGYADIPGHLPDEVAGLLPDGLFSSSPSDAADALSQLTGLDALLSVLFSALGLRLGDVCRLSAVLIGLLLLCAVLKHIAASWGERTGSLITWMIRLILFVAAARLTAGLADTVTAFFGQLSDLTAGFLPVMTTLYAMGGNVTQAAAGQGLLIASLALINHVCTSFAPPVCGVCMALSLFDLLGTRLHAGILSCWIRKTYTGLLGLSMFLLSALLGTQTLLSASRDTIRMKGMRYAVGQMIPVVGGAVSASLNTLSSGIGVLRRVTGTAGIVLLGLLLLPTLIELLLFRQALTLSAGAASMLDCPQEGRLLEELGSLYGYMAAAVAVSSVFFTMSLSLMATCGSVL